MMMKHSACGGVGAAIAVLVAVSPEPAVGADAAPEARKWLPASAAKLPRWRGFNLQEKFIKSRGAKPFLEEDFRLIAKLGFNFVRLPMDYRFWIKGGDWTQFDEAVLAEIDQAVEWGGKYGIHVCINFHRAPGYTVARPPEPTSLWTDAETQRVCALHWATFARRYKGTPGERLSFNLMNEPSGIEGSVYHAVVKILVEAIRREDPGRLIIADGLDCGQKPCLELLELGVAQATRGYAPSAISHYRASWVQGGDKMPPPAWPRGVARGVLYGPIKKNLAEPLRIRGPFAGPTRMRLRVGTVSSHATLVAKADDATVFSKEFKCGPGEGEWKKAVFRPEWKIHQNEYDRDYEAEIPAGAQEVELSLTAGDWLTITHLGFRAAAPGAPEHVLHMDTGWGRKPAPVEYVPDAADGPFRCRLKMDRDWLWGAMVAPWQEAESRGLGVIVGECGAYNRTPHDVTLRWLEDCLRNWKQAGWGWALWQFRGPFGVLDSRREDVEYEDFEGRKLDRKMLELLLKY